MTVTPFRGRLLADPVSALIQAHPQWPRKIVGAVLDSALNRTLITPAEFEQIQTGMAGRRGVVRLRAYWGLVDGRAESPPETYARLRAADAGIPPDDLHVVVRLPDGRSARGDLG